ncbi:MAG: winged helix-turn-helix domain-containing protein [Sulfurovaceae bacterium]|nr:winged helix-turn-helix domain-containing protein [Sulfurovaceae bacterium]
MNATMTQSEFAKHIGVTRQAVSKMKKEGILITENKRINVSKTKEYLEKLGRLKKGKKIDREISDTEVRDIADLKRQYLIERTRKTKLENDERQGILIEMDEAKRLVENFLTPIVQDMDNLPNEIKIEFPAISNEMIEYLRNYINNIKIKSQNFKL